MQSNSVDSFYSLKLYLKICFENQPIKALGIEKYTWKRNPIENQEPICSKLWISTNNI